MDAEQLVVTLYMQTQVLIGSIYQPREQRLLDLLNGVLLSPSENSGVFLKLSDLTISHADGKKERLETTYINKATIQLAVTPDGDSARGIGAKVGPKSYPFVPKSPVRVNLRMPTYTLIGSMHHAGGQRIQDILDERLMFLPLTNAKIHPITNGTWWAAPFVAVNREQILTLQEEIVPGTSLST